MLKSALKLVVIVGGKRFEFWQLKLPNTGLYSALQDVGTELKTLMVSVDAEIVDLPVECHTEVSISV